MLFVFFLSFSVISFICSAIKDYIVCSYIYTPLGLHFIVTKCQCFSDCLLVDSDLVEDIK